MFKYIALLLLVLPGILLAQSVEECMDCHSDEEMTGYIKDTVEVSMYVDLEKYQNSIHGDMECIDCHSSIDDVDHDEELPKVVCAECHEDSQEEYSVSVHAHSEEYLPGTVVICADCHGKHNILASDEPESKTYPLNIEKTCAECHTRPEVLQALGIRGDGPVKGYHNSVHNKLLHEDNDKNPPTCISCHDYHAIYVMTNPKSKFCKIHVAETCGSCHESEREDYEKSVHGIALARGHFESPTCNDCHGEHGIESPQDKDAVTNKINLSSQICANCHASPTMMRRFGLDPERFSTYSRTYHGLAVLKGSQDAANCTSCHEVHSIMSVFNPESSIHPENLQSTCGKCHENITAEFANIPVHPSQMETRNPIGYYVQTVYIWVIIVVVGGMFIHNLIILLYYIRQKRQALKNGRTYQRFQPFEVYQHMFLILSFFTLVITGFALKFPDALWVGWLVDIGMTEALRALIHRIAAVIMIIGSIIQAAYFMFSRKGQKDIIGLLPKISDITGFWQNMKFYLGKSKEHPKFGRWDYTEKAEYLALIWGTALMAITGLILWFPEIAMSILPSWSFEVSEIIHYFEAWLATLSIIIWHWFLVIYRPDKYPMSLTWMNGRISEEEMKHHHPLEYEELKNTPEIPDQATQHLDEYKFDR